MKYRSFSRCVGYGIFSLTKLITAPSNCRIVAHVLKLILWMLMCQSLNILLNFNTHRQKNDKFFPDAVHYISDNCRSLVWYPILFKVFFLCRTSFKSWVLVSYSSLLPLAFHINLFLLYRKLIGLFAIRWLYVFRSNKYSPHFSAENIFNHIIRLYPNSICIYLSVLIPLLLIIGIQGSHPIFRSGTT